MSIFEHIQYLVTRHDCIVMAGFGALVAQRIPATFSADGRMLLPPCRTLAFNSALTHDDGLLAGSIARRAGISFEAARAEAARQIELMRSRLAAEGSFEIPRVGRFTLTAENNIDFSPEAINPIVNSFFGALPTVTVANATQTHDDVEATILEVDTIGRRIGRRLVRAGKYAAAVALIIAAGATLTTPVLLDRPADQASLSLPAVKAPAKASTPKVLSVTMTSAVNYGPKALEQSAIATNVEIREEEPSAPKPMAINGPTDAANENDYRYYVIVGSCTSAKEAQRFIDRNGGNGKLGILKSDGRYRIYAAMTNNAGEASAFCANNPNIRANFPDAWVYTR